jgi:hypothetical protein
MKISWKDVSVTAETVWSAGLVVALTVAGLVVIAAVVITVGVVGIVKVEIAEIVEIAKIAAAIGVAGFILAAVARSKITGDET